MDKRKLVDIIIKDLEEIKVLSEEVAESDNDSSLVIDLALNRARLLCQEIGLLRELAGDPTIKSEETYEVNFDKEEEENAEFQYPDPELEILNFEDREYSEPEEMPEDENLEEFGEVEPEENEEEDLHGEDEGLSLEDDFEEENDDLIEMEEEDLDEENLEEDVLTEKKEMKKEPAEEKVAEIHQPEPEKKIHVTELKHEPLPGMREINIDDSDDQDDIQPVRFTPPAAQAPRPPMREIPKPEFLEPESPEKMAAGEKYHKERSLNDTLGEKKPMESQLTNGRISSLKAAIGLNDRFLFIREIFNNNAEKYDKVIDHLDKLQQISEAVEYLKANLTMQKNEASMKFVDLLKRRFIP